MYAYEECSESKQMQYLMSVLIQFLQIKKIKAEVEKSSKSTSWYCQFTGGGDIYINNKDISMAINIPTEDEQEDSSLPWVTY